MVKLWIAFVLAAGTPAGTNGSPTFTGTPFSNIINHTHPVTDPGHTHLTQRYPTATGSSSGFTIDTSMSGTLANNTLPTASATTGVTTSNPAGGVASITPAGTVSAPTFTGSPLGTHPHTLSGTSAAVSAGTPAGTNSAPAFTGTQFDNRSAHMRVIACRVN